MVTQVQCPPPEAPRHGKAVYTSCAYNSVVSYECKYGYRLVGDATRRCGADKKWSGLQPMCKGEYSFKLFHNRKDLLIGFDVDATVTMFNNRVQLYS